MIASGSGVPVGLVGEITATLPEIACGWGLGTMVSGRSMLLPSDWSARSRTYGPAGSLPLTPTGYGAAILAGAGSTSPLPPSVTGKASATGAVASNLAVPVRSRARVNWTPALGLAVSH